MRIGIVGLGLIGGSIAKSIRKNSDHEVYGMDKDPVTLAKAKMVGAIDKELKKEDIKTLDLLILALYPKVVIPFLKDISDDISVGSIVMDTCGIKTPICEEAFPIAKEKGFIFVGGHPMAGLEFSGFDVSTTSLFEKASMILVPPPDIPIGRLEGLKDLFLNIGFSHIEISTYEKHDKIIALSSQLAHIVSSAYIKSPQAPMHRGFSAGSFHDMTRVARLNEELWSQLFYGNKENLVSEIDSLISRLAEYSDALKGEDKEKMYSLLSEGHKQRERLE